MSGPPSDPERTRRILGALVIVAGVAGAALLWWSAGERRESAVTGFARAPVGCDTTLDFTSTGTFYLYVERTGNFDDLAGDCEASGEFALDDADGEPAVRLELLDPGGREVVLTRERGIDYSAAGFSGTVVRSAEIADTGEYVLRVGSDEGVFAIAVGRQPDDGVAMLRSLAVGALLLGVVLGGLLLLLARRAAGATPPHVVVPPWPPQPTPGMQGWAPGAPSGPPIAGPAGRFPLPGPPPPPPQVGSALGPPMTPPRAPAASGASPAPTPPPAPTSTPTPTSSPAPSPSSSPGAAPWAPLPGPAVPAASPSTPAAPPSSWGVPMPGAPDSARLWQPPAAPTDGPQIDERLRDESSRDESSRDESSRDESSRDDRAGQRSSVRPSSSSATEPSPWAPPRPD